MKKIFKTNLENNNFLVILISASLWMSIGTKLSLDGKLELDMHGIQLVINFSRYFLPYLILFYLIVKKIKNTEITYYKNLLNFLFISFLIGYINFYFFNPIFLEKTKINADILGNGYFPNKIKDIFFCLSLMITSWLLLRLNSKNLRTMNIINYLFIVATTLLTTYFAYQEYLFSNKYYLYYTNFLVHGDLMGVSSIRSLGLSRNYVLISIPLTVYLFFSEKKINFKIFGILFLIFSLTNLYQLQSRTSVYSFYIFFTILIFYFLYKKFFLKILQIISILILIPLFLSSQIPKIKSYILDIRIEAENNRIFNFNPNNLDDLSQSNIKSNQKSKTRVHKSKQSVLKQDIVKEFFTELPANDNSVKAKLINSLLLKKIITNKEFEDLNTGNTTLKDIGSEDRSLIRDEMFEISAKNGLINKKVLEELVSKQVINEDLINQLVNNNIITKNESSRWKSDLIQQNLDIKNQKKITSQVNQYVSGRLALWDQTIDLLINKNDYRLRFLGYGPAADRYLLSENVSNAFMYSILSGGILGGLSLIFFYLFILFIFYKFLLLKKAISENIIEYSCFFIILIISIRSIVENSFTVFGTDHIILVSSLMCLSASCLLKNKN